MEGEREKGTVVSVSRRGLQCTHAAFVNCELTEPGSVNCPVRGVAVAGDPCRSVFCSVSWWWCCLQSVSLPTPPLVVVLFTMEFGWGGVCVAVITLTSLLRLGKLREVAGDCKG